MITIFSIFVPLLAVVVDFSQPGPWFVGQGRFPGQDAVRQCRRDADGLHVDVDVFRSSNPTLISVEAKPGSFRVTPREDRQLTCRFSKPFAVKTAPRMLVRDTGQEIFQFSPSRTRIEADGAFVFTYHPSDEGYAGATWGSKNLNRRLDDPVHLFGFVFDFAEPSRTGTVTLVRYEPAVEPIRRAVRDVTGTEDLSDRLTAGFPGPKPFPGPEELILTTDAALTGTVSMALAPRDGGKPLFFETKGGREMRFKTNLPFDTHYVLKGISQPFRAVARTLRGHFRQTAAEALRLDVDTGNPLHISRGEAEEPVVLVLRNAADRPVSWKGTVRVHDYWKNGFNLSVAHTVAAGESLRLPVGRQLAKGIWRVTAQVKGDDGSEAEPETRFAVLDRHVVTPKVPFGNYRIGVNYHMARFAERDLQLTLDAITAMGAKIVRAGTAVNFGDTGAGGPGVYRWEKPDRLIGLLEERGLAIDTIIYGVPRWAQRPEFAKCRRPHLTPVFADALETYCRAVAARYGTRIDYYELGNEWDLAQPGEMTVDDAVNLMKAAWRGVKAGCAQARLMPNGWALEASDHPMIVLKGFQEETMERTKGFYDVHPIHVHGRFPYYEARMREAFFAFRRARGIEVPWFANETALTSAHGAEDLVAETVFKKILWSQAFGSTDYIWYNLRATGWVPADGEQGYGLITADYYPRAGYAAFSAVAAVFGGLAADGVLVAERGRFVLRFKGERRGVRRLALAGWDDNLTGLQDVRVRTDAARAFATDLMGNATEVPVRGGQVTWRLGRDPGGLVLEGASLAEPVMADVRAFPPPRTDFVTVPISDPSGRGPDFVLNASEQAQELWKANPATEHRTWKGPQDLSAEIRLAWTEAHLRVLADVTDDRDVPGAGDLSRGDSVCLRFVGADDRRRDVWLVRDAQGRPQVYDGTGRPLEKARVSIVRAGQQTHYDADLPWKSLGLPDTMNFGFDVRVMEDDGEGRDGWLSPSEPERDDRLSRIRFLKLRQW